MEEETKLVFITDAHGQVNTFEKIKEIIDKYKPVFVLAESLENNNILSEYNFTKIMKKKKISNMTSMEEVKELIKLCHKKNIKLIGIDFENFLIGRKLQTKINRNMNLTEDEEKELESLALRRENKHVKMIGKYLELSRKPIVVIIGAWHFRKNSQIRRTFDHYILYYLSNPKGEMVLGPTKEKLEWKELIK